MLRTSAAAARSYYAGSRGEYYAEGRDEAGVWDGKASAMLGLASEVIRAAFARLCENEVWSYDFVFDQTADVVKTLAKLVAERGWSAYVRSDNGPDFVAAAVKGWLATAEIGALHIEPGSPWENAYCESFNSRLRDEVLNREVFGSRKEAEVILAEYRRACNHDRPHSSLGYVAPAVFAARCSPSPPVSLDQAASKG